MVPATYISFVINLCFHIENHSSGYSTDDTKNSHIDIDWKLYKLL